MPGTSRTNAASRSLTGQEGDLMLKKIMYSLGALAMLAMAVGAGFKPN